MLLPKITPCRKDFDETILCLFDKDDELFEKYNEISEKVKDTLKKEFDNEPVYNKKIFKS